MTRLHWEISPYIRLRSLTMRQSRSATDGVRREIDSDCDGSGRLQRLHGSESDRAGCRFVRGKSRREHACGRALYPYPLKQRIAGAKGHLSNLAAGHLLCEILHDNLQEVLLGHLSKENNYEALAFETVACEVTTGDNPYGTRVIFISLSLKEAKYHR